MKKPKLTKEFDVNLLDQLVGDESVCVYMHKLRHHLALHPFHLNDLNGSIKDILNRDIAKYSTKLDGILFGYKNIKFLSRLGQICDDSCFVHVDIEADFFIFKPEVGKTLQGVVNKKSEDHVGCLIHKIFNVALPRPKHADNWPGHSVSVNSEILLTITQTNFEGKLPYIRGEITSILSNPDINDSKYDLSLGDEENATLKKKKHSRKLRFESFEEPKNLEDSQEKKKSKKRKKSVSEQDLFSEAQDSEIVEDSPDKRKSKKRKKSISEKDSFSELLESGVEEDYSPNKKKSRKRKKSFSETDITEELSVKKKSKKSKKRDMLDQF